MSKNVDIQSGGTFFMQSGLKKHILFYSILYFFTLITPCNAKNMLQKVGQGILTKSQQIPATLPNLGKSWQIPAGFLGSWHIWKKKYFYKEHQVNHVYEERTQVSGTMNNDMNRNHGSCTREGRWTAILVAVSVHHALSLFMNWQPQVDPQERCDPYIHILIVQLYTIKE